jgi:hypothetical protein
VRSNSRKLTQLEAAMLPEAARTRRAIAHTYDQDARYRVVENERDSTGFSQSLSAGYVVGPHDDSGKALEAIGFAYPSQTPMPEGHKWEMAVSGCIHPLPKDRNEFVLLAVRGEGVFHGTLPTSSTLPHLANHRGVGSALVSKKEMIDVLWKQQQPGALPAPTREQLLARAEEVKAQKNLSDPERAGADLTAAMEQRDAADSAFNKALQAAAAAAEDVPALRTQLEGVQDQMDVAAVEMVLGAGSRRQALRDDMSGSAHAALAPVESNPQYAVGMLQKIKDDDLPVITDSIQMPRNSVKKIGRAHV